ncbi:integrator complex assembly factor BRAT1 isoform X2 [Mustelus asterias]
MESDYVELLPRVCAVLGDSRQSVVDDTCLEKLLDCFQAITKDETELYILQRIPCLTDIIVNISKQRDLNPSTLSFIMRLTGLFAASENYFCKLEALKLLSKVSGSSHPVAIISLWPRIEESIKLLLKGDLTGIGQPLAELFLNISRAVPCDVLELKIWDLLSLLLRSLNQAEALMLASGILKLKNCSQSLTVQAATVLLQPLNYIITVTSVQPQEGTVLLDSSSNYRVDIEHQLSRKSACINLTCQTLSHLLEFLQMPSRKIELPYQALIHSVLTVLKLCIGAAIPTTSAGVNISRHLIGCIKVQRAGIDVLGAIPQRAGGIEEVKSALNLLLDYIRNPDTDSTVLKKTLQALFHWMSHCTEAVDSHALEPKLKEFLDGDFLSVMKKRLFDVHWEIRDSTLEFLGQLCFQFKEVESFCQLIGSCGIPCLVLELLSDPESYVRASAISTLGKMNYLSPNWQMLPNDNTVAVVKGDILSHLLDILNEDTEGFPRRAAVKVLVDWLKNRRMLSSNELENCVPVILKLGSNDLDWEVKVHSLELAEAFIDLSTSNLSITPYAIMLSNSTHSTQVNALLQTLCNVGIFTILFSALWDCDRPVAQKACEILIKLKRIVLGADNADNKPTGLKPNRESFGDWLSNSNLNLQNVNDVLEVMTALDLEFQHQQLVRSSDHIESSLRSLLQDILAAAENSEDSGADCY